MSPIVALHSSDDMNCKGEASRAIANLSSNSEIQKEIIWEGTLKDGDAFVQPNVMEDVTGISDPSPQDFSRQRSAWPIRRTAPMTEEII